MSPRGRRARRRAEQQRLDARVAEALAVQACTLCDLLFEGSAAFQIHYDHGCLPAGALGQLVPVRIGRRQVWAERHRYPDVKYP